MGSLKLFDTVQFRLLDPNLVKVKDDYPGAFKPDPQGNLHSSGMGLVGTSQQTQASTRQGLQVRIAASHSGLITRNNGFYLPDRMKKGVTSFTDNYGKPVLLHHNDHQDPVGRIIESRYRDTSGSIIDQYSGLSVKDKAGREKGKITPQLISDFCDGKMPFGMQVDIVRSLFRDSLLEEPSYEGLGYIELVAQVTDLSAIEKLLDGRYLTGSVGATTDAAVCSVCRQDWTDTGPCEHSPGGIYDGVKCFIIAGNLVYDEYSFVNVPADRHSRVLELNYNGVQDSVKTEDKFHGKLYEVNLSFPQYDEETSMTVKTETQIKDSVTEPVLEPTTEPVVSTVEVVVDSNSPVADPAPQTEVVSVLEKLLVDGQISDEESEALYTMVYDELVSAVNDGTLIMDKAELENAKLSTEQRKKLAKSSFCGPSRSFPVPDCAHVTAAKRLLGRAKASGETKEKILSCVNRKAKAMGCKESKAKDAVIAKDSVATETILPQVETPVAIKLTNELMSVLDKKDITFSAEDNEILAAIFKLLVEKTGKDAFINALKQSQIADNLVQDAEQELLNEIAKYEEELGELKERLEANRKEYTSLSQDFEGLQDSLIVEKVKTRKILESHLSMLKALRDQKIESHDHSVLSDTALQTEIDQVLKTVDMTKITDKLGDGMSRVPVGDIESPTVIQDQATTNQKSQLDANALYKIRDEYLMIRLSKGQTAAEAFLKRMKMEGKLPQE